jgi:glyoxylase-like metal-dependent hydrolase (beta-lactamase superfamily II)
MGNTALNIHVAYKSPPSNYPKLSSSSLHPSSPSRYLIHDPTTKQTAAIDTPCAASYRRELDKRGWTLTHILNTHHHSDHVGGNVELKVDGVKVYGPAIENIPCMDVPLRDGDELSFAGTNAVVMGEFFGSHEMR